MGRRPIKRSLVLLIELHEIDSSIELKSMSEIGPHFIVIGAQRAGTTWLHRVLSQHERLWLTPVKELHYFDKQSIKLGVLSKYERHRARFWSFPRKSEELSFSLAPGKAITAPAAGAMHRLGFKRSSPRPASDRSANQVSALAFSSNHYARLDFPPFHPLLLRPLVPESRALRGVSSL